MKLATGAFVRSKLARFLSRAPGALPGDRRRVVPALALHRRPASAPESARIVITPGQVERLTQLWTKTHLRPPSAEELAGLVEQEIDDEILYREAVAMGLDRDDLVIRRRLAVKMEFLTDDLAAVADPDRRAVASFSSASIPTSSTSNRSPPLPRSTLTGPSAVREQPRKQNACWPCSMTKVGSDWQSLGDPLPLPNEFQDASGGRRGPPSSVGSFPGSLPALPVGRWSGPVESGYGLHLVLVRKRTAGRSPPLDEVRDAVLSEWRAAQRRS